LAFARRLGYRSNPVTDWEHGRRYPTAQEALRIAERVGIDVKASCERFAPGMTLLGAAGQYALGDWMRTLLGTTTVSELARRMSRSRPTLSRWLGGSAHPRLHEFFEFLDAATGRLPDFVAELVPIAQVPALTQRFEVTQAARRVALEKPWTEGILRVLETERYHALSEHDSHWLAQVFGIAEAEVNDCLEQLTKAQIVRHQDVKYVELRPLHVDTRGGRAALYATKAHWAKVATARVLNPQPRDFFAYNVCSASTEDMERIRETLHAAFRDVRSIVAASTPLEQVALVNLHFVRWPVN
jgi:transcriptional regulator with XRE-family HTH domain